MFIIYSVVLYMIVKVNCDGEDVTSNIKIKNSAKIKNQDMPDNLQDYDDYKNKTLNNTTVLKESDVSGLWPLDSYSDLDQPVKEKYAEVLGAKKSIKVNDTGAVADRDGKMDKSDAKRGNKDAKEAPAAGTLDPEDTKSQLRNLIDRYKVTIDDGQPAFNVTAGNKSMSEWALGEPELMEQWSGSGEVKMRAGPARMGQGKHIPSAIELDMAPARGGAVHTLRVKNRLCYRHVMIPEGPKYDSRGKLYLGEFERTKGKEYTQTKPPKLLLPKCCNCCRKSVLGCE